MLKQQVVPASTVASEHVTVAVDARNWLCSLLHKYQDKVLVDRVPVEDIVPALAHADALRYSWQYEHHRLVFVLDAPRLTQAQPLKREVIQKRAVQHDERKARVERLVKQGKSGEARKVAKRAPVRLGRQALERAVSLLRSQGFRVVQAPCEAEAQAAYWARVGIVGLVASGDFDALLHGAPRVCRAWPESLEVTTPGDVVRQHGAESLRHLVEANVVAGRTDYAPCLPGIRDLRHALSELLRVGSFETLVSSCVSDASRWRGALLTFENPNVITEPPL